MTMTELIDARRELTDSLANCEPGCFPGSKGARKEDKCLMELDTFDDEHPEVLPEIRRRKCTTDITKWI